jgi:integrase
MIMAILQECPTCKRRQKLAKNKCLCGEDLQKARKGERVKFYVTYRLPGGRQKKVLVGTSLKDAKALDGKKKGEKREKRLFDVLPECKMTFKELSDWFLGLGREKAKPVHKRRRTNLKHFNETFGETVVANIKPADLEEYQVRRKGAGMSDCSVDLEIADAKTVVYKAFENSIVGGNTLRVFKTVRNIGKRNANARDRILTPEEFTGLMDNAADHLRPIIATAYYTGMRLGEILPLTWEKIDFKERVIRLAAEDTKDRERRTIPICEALMEVLRAIPRGIHGPVFRYAGRAITDIETGIANACEKAKILYGRKTKGGFTFHDLRHTFNTNMRKAGVAESVIMDITGHSTREMFDRYNTVDETDRGKAIKQLEAFLGESCQNVAQAPA